MLFALLPGAGCEPWIWHRVVSELPQRGHDAIAVRLPYADQRAGLSEYADAVASAIGAREDVALVAHRSPVSSPRSSVSACRCGCSCSSTR